MPTPSRPGIPTTFQNTNFRSRLESRWAAMFDLLGWQWVYEPLDCSGYIPDFLIQGPHPFFVEVGPCITLEDYVAKAAKPTSVASELGHDVLIVGVDPLPPFGAGYQYAGWLGEYGAHEEHDPDYCEPGCAQKSGMWFDHGRWTTCTRLDLYPRRSGCGAHGVTSEPGSFAVRPCSHYPGGAIYDADVDIQRLWREAGNRVQWKAA